MRFMGGGDGAVEGTSGSTYEAFMAERGPDLRRALVARYGLEVGLDVAADVFAYAWEHWDALSEKSNPAGYLFRVGQSAARRYRPRRVAMPPQAETPGPDHDPRLARALEQLSARQRSAVVLICIYDWTYPAAAAVLGVSESSLRNHVRRGLTSLRHQLGDDDE